MKKIYLFFLLFSWIFLQAEHETLLSSWNEGPAKKSIIEFVQKVSNKNSPFYVTETERIAVFDNDGTLWGEKPVYFQLLFAIDQVETLAPQHPEWKQQQPFQAILEKDVNTLKSFGQKEILEIIMATHAGQSTQEFEKNVKDWLKTAHHPQFHKPYTEMTYLPMKELIDYLKANRFKVFIVSGGGIEFIRAFSEQAYGIPPEQVVGSTIKTEYQLQNGKPILIRLPEIDFINDGPGKPVGINQYIGKRPIFAFGNSDGDFEMLEWVTKAGGQRLGLLLHHDDKEREWAYDKNSKVGKLEKGLKEGPKQGWIIVSMKEDWSKVFKDSN